MSLNGFTLNSAILNGSGTAASILSGSISEDISVADTVLTGDIGNIAEGVTILHTFSQSLTFFLSENFAIDDTAAAVVNTALAEGISILHTSLPTLFTSDSVSESVVIQDVLNVLLEGIVTESLTLDDLPTALPIFLSLVNEKIETGDTTSSVLHATNVVLAGMLLSDILSHVTLGTLTEVINVSDIVAESAKRLEAVLDALSIADTHSEFNLLVGVADESLTVLAGLTPTQILSVLLSEGIVMMSLPNRLGGEYTGWVLNPETFSIWNYSNYHFNSMTTVGKRTLMANSSGLFQMGGTLDITANIVSRIKTAAVSGGTTNIKNFPEIYLGLQTDGEVVVVVKTDERLEVKYKVSSVTTVQDLQHVKLGKGLRGSTWQFELIDNNSTQFDLTGIELYPVVYGRKRR